MSARVLVVDDVVANVRLLEAKLLSEYYEVLTATNGADALEIVRTHHPDIVLLDVMMPGMNGFEVCRKIKADPGSAHIPVVMVTALSDTRDRVEGLSAGADEFLTKPPDDIILFARIRSLVRLKRAADEWRTREATLMQFGGRETDADAMANEPTGNVLLVMQESGQSDQIEDTLLDQGHEVTVARTCEDAESLIRSEEFHLVLVDDQLAGEDSLRLCSHLRSQERTRHWPILLILDYDDSERMAKALELGVSDGLMRPFDRDELIARTRSQIRRKWYEDGLRRRYEDSLAAAVTDSLTGVHNRRYLETHFGAVQSALAESTKPISLMILDIDRFKAVNDTYGHSVGDDVLKGLAKRLELHVRGADTAVRFGGEEFVVLMPNTSLPAAAAVAERLCHELGSEPYPISQDPGELDITVSIGTASITAGEAVLEDLVRRADEALYQAKNAGRNRTAVWSSKPAKPAEEDRQRAVND